MGDFKAWVFIIGIAFLWLFPGVLGGYMVAHYQAPRIAQQQIKDVESQYNALLDKRTNLEIKYLAEIKDLKNSITIKGGTIQRLTEKLTTFQKRNETLLKILYGEEKR